MDNLEWIRTLDAMSLADLIDNVCDMCACDPEQCRRIGSPCRGGVWEWLEQEHEEPDTWEKIEADACLNAVGYWGCIDYSCKECPSEINGRKPHAHYNVATCDAAQNCDLVRRCKALAEKERG